MIWSDTVSTLHPRHQTQTKLGYTKARSRRQTVISMGNSCRLRPILMQLDLQSVEKVLLWSIQYVHMSFAPLENGLPRLKMSRTLLQDPCRAPSRFSRSSVAGNHRQHFFDPTGSNTIDYNHPRSDRQRVIEKVLTVISCNWASGEAGNSSG